MTLNKDKAIAAVKGFFVKAWEFIRTYYGGVIIFLSLLIVDLVSKSLINANMRVGESITLIPNFLHFTNVHNMGAAFGASYGMGAVAFRVVFSIISVAATVLFLIFLYRKRGKSKLLTCALAMMAAGALGNGIDRMFLGYVRDFIEFYYFGLEIAGSKSFYVFNVADAALIVGMIIFLIYFLFIYREKPKENSKEAVAEEALTMDADEIVNKQKSGAGETGERQESDKPSEKEDESDTLQNDEKQRQESDKPSEKVDESDTLQNDEKQWQESDKPSEKEDESDTLQYDEKQQIENDKPSEKEDESDTLQNDEKQRQESDKPSEKEDESDTLQNDGTSKTITKSKAKAKANTAVNKAAKNGEDNGDGGLL